MSIEIFDSNGMFITPKSVIEENEMYTKKLKEKKNIKTGVYVTCPKCNNRWQRCSYKKGSIKCRKCNGWIKVEKIEHEGGEQR